jgi:hypothetical protein
MEGWEWSGWNEEIPSVMPDHNVFITSTATQIVYTISYIVDNTVWTTRNYHAGDTIVHIDGPAKEGYIFESWNGLPVNNIMPASNVGVTAYYRDADKVKLIYKIDGVLYREVYLTEGQQVTPMGDPEPKQYHQWTGWTGEPQTAPAQDIVINGHFEPNDYTLDYILDGELYTSVTYKYNAPVTPLAAPQITGKRFGGWQDEPEFMPPVNHYRVYGQTTAILYTFNYIVDNSVYETYQLAYGETIPECTPNIPGYRFVRWEPAVPATMPANDMSVTAVLVPLAYKLRFLIDRNLYRDRGAGYDQYAEWRQMIGGERISK